MSESAEEKILSETESEKEDSACENDNEISENLPPCCRHKTRSPEEYKCLMNRLKRIEGQVRGIRRMLEEDAYCPDILTQSAAVTAAMNAFNRELLSNHIKTCVADGIKNGDDEVIDELLKTIHKLMK